MSVSQAYRAQTLELLDAARAVRARPMFGEIGLYAGDQFFGMMVDDALYFKVDDTNRADYEARGIGPFYAPWNSGRPTGYCAVPTAVLEDAEQLGAWIDKAVAVAARKPKKKR